MEGIFSVDVAFPLSRALENQSDFDACLEFQNDIKCLFTLLPMKPPTFFIKFKMNIRKKMVPLFPLQKWQLFHRGTFQLLQDLYGRLLEVSC